MTRDPCRTPIGATQAEPDDVCRCGARYCLSCGEGHSMRAPLPAVEPARAWAVVACAPDRTFRSFVIDGSNRRAFALVRHRTRCANANAAALLITGPSGVGKTHLLHAAASKLRARHPGTRVTLLTAEAWMNAYVASIRRDGAPAFLASMVAACDALLIDGVEDFDDKPGSLEVLGRLAKQVVDRSGLVALACAEAATPATMEVLGGVLAPRVVEVRASGATLRYEVLVRMQPKWPTRVPVAVLWAIAQMAGSVPEAMGMMNRCVFEWACCQTRRCS